MLPDTPQEAETEPDQAFSIPQSTSEAAHDLERSKPGAGDQRTGFEDLMLADGERGTMQATWSRKTPRPILWRKSGTWPEWCSLFDAPKGTVVCHPPLQTLPGDYGINVTAVGLDSVDGLSQETFRAVVSVVDSR